MIAERRILLGHIAGAHGVQGWVRVRSHTQPRENILRYRPWTVRYRDGEFQVDDVRGRVQGQGVIAHWSDLLDRDQAEALKGAEIWVARTQLPPAGPDEVYWFDLEGLRVVGVDGYDFGRIDHLLSTGSNDVMSVRGERERLIPFIRDDVVKRVDLDAGLLEVDWDPEF